MASNQSTIFVLLSDLSKQLSDLRMGVPARSLVLQDQIGPHTTAREVFDPFIVLGQVSVSIEMTWAVISSILQELDQPKCRPWVSRSKPQVLIVAARDLIVQVDVKQLARLPCLRDRMRHVQSRHMFVGHFR